MTDVVAVANDDLDVDVDGEDGSDSVRMSCKDAVDTKEQDSESLDAVREASS